MRSVRIGDVVLDGRVVMAPLAGVGGPVFRQVAREHGASLVVTPLISAVGLTRGDPKSWEMARGKPEEEPRAVQIFGSEPEIMAEAALLLQDRGTRIIDLNFGCPARRIVANGSGSALLRDGERLRAIADAAVKAVSIPVTAKIRLGWNRREIVVIRTVRALEDAGIAAITLHARAKSDSPATIPSWEWIARAVQEVSIPVIGNGGIEKPRDAKRMVDQTDCAAVMIGRAAVGRPWLLQQAASILSGQTPAMDPPWRQRLGVALHHLTLQAETDPNNQEFFSARGVASAYLRGMPDARRYRPLVLRTSSYGELIEIIRSLRNQWISPHLLSTDA